MEISDAAIEIALLAIFSATPPHLNEYPTWFNDSYPMVLSPNPYVFREDLL